LARAQQARSPSLCHPFPADYILSIEYVSLIVIKHY
jgi:hypothetical protein